MFVIFSRSLAEVENTSTVQKDDRIMEMKRNVEGKDNRIIELESRYCVGNTCRFNVISDYRSPVRTLPFVRQV